MGESNVIFSLIGGVFILTCILQIHGDNSLEQSEFEYVLLNNQNPCKRECQSNMPPMVCKFKFRIEWYLTMSKACYNCPYNVTDCFRPDCVAADGVRRAIVTINRQLPGPFIEVCKGDLVIVDVENDLGDEGTTIHWHGQHQRGTPYMDGTPTITQCPILPKNTFRYKFYANQPGTHFWHSHMGLQRGDGAFGGFIVRIPRAEDPHTELYDLDLSEHQIVFLDWDHTVGVERFQAHHQSDGDNKPPGLLVNGHGKFQLFPTNENGTELHTPFAKFTVLQGFRYRFRMINSGYLNCPIEVNIDNHDMLVISSDGKDIEPVQVSSVVTYAGERFDFIIYANETIDNYWIRFQGLMDCDQRFTSTFQTAILHYDGAPDAEPIEEVHYETAHKDGMQLNALNTPEGDPDSILMSQVRSIESNDPSLKEIPDMQLFLAYDFNPTDNSNFHRKDLYGFDQIAPGELRTYTPQINHITMRLPKFPLMPERKWIKPDMFCNETTMVDCENRFCECTYVYQIPLNAVVELVFIDQGFTYDANHPLHLHGHYFRVISMDKIGKNTTVEEFKEYDRLGLVKRNLDRPPFKDTVTIPDGGYTIVRLHANNPGYWLFHCHIEWHSENGMALIFKIGEHNQFPPIPKNFPKCYDYHQTSDEIFTNENDDTTLLTNSIATDKFLQLALENSTSPKSNDTNFWWPFEHSSSNYLLPTNLMIITLFIVAQLII